VQLDHVDYALARRTHRSGRPLDIALPYSGQVQVPAVQLLVEAVLAAELELELEQQRDVLDLA
jgi:hypothetical protein